MRTSAEARPKAASERASKKGREERPGARVCTEKGRLRGRLCGRPCCPDERADGQYITVNILFLN